VFESYTANTRAVLNASFAAAKQLRHAYIGPEHIMIGLARVPCTGHHILIKLGCAPTQLEAKVLASVRKGTTPVEESQLPFTPRAKRIAEIAHEHARQLNRDELATEHLLLGILDEGESLPAYILDEHGVERSVVYAMVQDRGTR
jgi:ATP-dependent Clp protease ATP-binding subunit ClpC